MAMNQVKNETVFVFADLVGSTPFKETHSFEEGLLKTREHNDLICKFVDKYHGRIFKLVGDGIIAMFDDSNSYFRALSASIECLREIDNYNEDKGYHRKVKKEYKIETRIGISYGVTKPYKIGAIEDLVGECLDEAARLCSITLPNTILFKKSLLDKIQKDKFTFYRNNPNFFSNIIDNLNVKGKKESLDVCIISLDDIINSYNKRIAKNYYSPTKKLFLQGRPLREINYVAVGGFMFTGKGVVARNLSTKFGWYLIQDDFKDNQYLKWLYEILHQLPKDINLEEISRRSILTNLWFINNKLNLLYESIKENRDRFNRYISDFHLYSDMLYCFAEQTRLDREFISDIYDKLENSNKYVKPDAIIFLTGSADYLMEIEKKKAERDPIRKELEKNISKEYIEYVLKHFDLYRENVRGIPMKIIDIEKENIDDENSSTYVRIEKFLKETLEIS